jgi:hypothetical protein
MARRLMSYQARHSLLWVPVLLVVFAISLAIFKYPKSVKQSVRKLPLTTHSTIVPVAPTYDASNVSRGLVLGKTVWEDTDWLFNSGFNEYVL